MGLITRRALLGGIAGGGLLRCGEATFLNSESSPAAGIFDAHVHVWTSDTGRYPLASGFQRQDLWFPSFTPDDLFESANNVGLTRVNLVQMTWYAEDHRYMTDIIAKAPGRFVGTGIVPAVTDISGPSPEHTMVALSKQGIRAFRIRGKSARPPIGDGSQWMNHSGYDTMFAAAAEHNLGLSFLMSASDIPELDRMCQRFPQAPVIIDHLCLIGAKGTFPEEEVEALCGMAKHRRVLVKIGAFYGLGTKKPPYLELLPLIRKVVTAFGPQRCMWESDSPLQTKPPQNYESSVALLRDRAEFLSPADREQILFHTAEAFFFKRQRV